VGAKSFGKLRRARFTVAAQRIGNEIGGLGVVSTRKAPRGKRQVWVFWRSRQAW